jgi:hypothetical protein
MLLHLPDLRLLAVVVAAILLAGVAFAAPRPAPAAIVAPAPELVVSLAVESPVLPLAGVMRSHALPITANAVYDAQVVEANIVRSLAVSPGLQAGVIAPGETWSFNEQWLVSTGDLVTAYGVLGAGVCDLAALYADVAYQLGLAVRFTDHAPIDLLYAPGYANVAIWGTPGQRGGADLEITNTTSNPISYATLEMGGAYVVEMWEGDSRD